jgi:serine protease Do
MKKIILLALAWPLCSYPLYAQDKKEKTKEEGREIIIIKSGDKEKKLTIETKDGEVYINGKPSKEYKDDDVNVIRQKFKGDKNFLYAPGTGDFTFFDRDGGDKGFLGVTTEKADDGVKITDVSKGSAADKAGLKEGDIITKVGDKKITDTDDLSDVVSAHKSKDEVTISYKRDGKAADTKATLERRSFSRTFSYNGDMFNNQNWSKDFDIKMPKLATIPDHPFTMAWGMGRGRLGVRIEDTDNDGGVKITDVDDGSAAAKAGLKENDIITEVNGKKVKDVNEARKEMTEIKDKNSYMIKAKRNGSEMNFEIKVPKKINKADI